MTSTAQIITTKYITPTKETSELDDILNYIFEGTHYSNKHITFISNYLDNGQNIIKRQTWITDKIIENNFHLITNTYFCMSSYLNTHNPNKDYQTFYIPKANGKYRRINAPKYDLLLLQRQLLSLFEQMQIYPSNWAYAYIKGKSTLDMAKVHKDSNYILKIDFHNFFPSIDSTLLKDKLTQNYTFSEIEETQPGFIDALVQIATLNDTLPQGSPLSPFLSNIVMIEFDMQIRQALQYKYTRYADDLVFSSNYHIPIKDTINTINNIINRYYDNKLTINKEKTKELTNLNRCYIVGIKLNKDHNLTYGHEHKTALKLELFNLFKNYENHTLTKEEAQETLGRFSYMKQIEPNYAHYLERKLLKRFNSKVNSIFKHFKF